MEPADSCLTRVWPAPLRVGRKFNIKRHVQLLEQEAEEKERAKVQAEELAFRDDPEVCTRPYLVVLACNWLTAQLAWGLQYRRMSRKDRRELTKNLKKDKEPEPHGRASLPAYVYMYCMSVELVGK